MIRVARVSFVALGSAALLAVVSTHAQQPRTLTPADYERATGLRQSLPALALNIVDNVTAVTNTSRFTYRKSVKGGHEFVVVDAATQAKKPAFDHDRLAKSLSAATGNSYTAVTLPFTTFQLVDNERTIQATIAGSDWRCDATSYTCKSEGEAAGVARPTGLADLSAPPRQPPTAPIPSPDGTWEALVLNFNVAIRPKGKTRPADATILSLDGSPANFYDLASFAWAPNSKMLAAYRVRPGQHRKITYIESSPADQIQPKYWTREYAKPGDALDIEQPVLFDIAASKQFEVENRLFPNAYTMSNPVWRKDSRAFTFEYDQRGHQAFRVVEVDATTGKARAVIDELPKTFFNHGRPTAVLASAGKKYRHDLGDGKEIIWMSERDNWSHLYLYDGITGGVKNQITKGDWLVRDVIKIDDTKRQIWFVAGGMYKGKDPYFAHYYRINFDGTGLTPFTETDADHNVVFSSDMQYYVDTYSRLDMPPVVELRRVEGKQLLAELEKGDITELVAAGWKPPEIFVSKGRDGTTDIWGIIVRPLNYDPAKKYPVIEFIYAGPQGSFVPKAFTGGGPGAGNIWSMQSLAEMGFIVSQVDGMGTANRSKAFHDVAWKNLGDAGFPDRILWHKAINAKHPSYDITRVGIYGSSAGGQNSTGALLFHPEFYKAAVSGAGCHDNRMDKISWNEQWMSWPVGPQYSAASNVDNAHKLRGHLLLLVGELDTNVDPASTMQVVNALIKANKKFEMLMIPGAGHGTGGPLTDRMRVDFFVHNLQGVEPPDWNSIAPAPTVPSRTSGSQEWD